jgi:hypothetical protein
MTGIHSSQWQWWSTFITHNSHDGKYVTCEYQGTPCTCKLWLLKVPHVRICFTLLLLKIKSLLVFYYSIVFKEMNACVTQNVIHNYGPKYQRSLLACTKCNQTGCLAESQILAHQLAHQWLSATNFITNSHDNDVLLPMLDGKYVTRCYPRYPVTRCYPRYPGYVYVLSYCFRSNLYCRGPDWGKCMVPPGRLISTSHTYGNDCACNTICESQSLILKYSINASGLVASDDVDNNELR